MKKRISRILNKTRKRRLNRYKSKSINKSRKRILRLNRSKNKSKSRNRRVRRRLKRSKNKRRNRKTHRGGFVEFGAALPCLPANSADNIIHESIRNFNPALLDSTNYKKIKSNIKNEGAIKWSKEGELENDYGKAACMDKPRGIHKNVCAYNESGKCDPNVDSDGLDKDLRKTVKDNEITTTEIESEFKKRGWSETDQTNSAGQKLWKGPTSKVDADKKALAKKHSDYQSQVQAKADYDAAKPKPTGAPVTISASLKKWFLGATTKV